MKIDKKIYEVKRGHGEILITKQEKRGSYIVCRMFDDDKKAQKIANEIANKMNEQNVK